MSALIRFRLDFPLELKEEAVVSVLGGLSHDLYRRHQPRPTIRLRLIATGTQLIHELDIPESLAKPVLARIRSSIPSLRTTQIDQPLGTREPRLVEELRLTNLHRPLKTDRSGPVSASLLNAVTGLGPSERIEMVWTLTGARPQAPARQIRPARVSAPSPLDLLMPTPSTWHQESEAVRQERTKQAEPLLLAVARIAIWTGSEIKATQLATSLITALRSTSAPGVALLPRQLSKGRLRRRFVADVVPRYSWSIVMNASELAGLIGWPIDGPQVPGLSLSGSRQLAPPNSMSRDESRGVVIADSTFPGVERPLVLLDQDRVLHTHIIGPTGVGKSTLLASMILADISHGHGVIVIDPGRDLVTDVLNRIPRNRHEDVIVLDPSDQAFPVGLNPLEQAGRSPDLVAEQLVGVLRSIFSAFWGPRTDDILRTAVMSLAYASTPQLSFTLVDTPRLLSDPRFRRQITGKLNDPVLLSSWASYEAMGQAGQAQAIAPVLNKLRSFLLRPSLRNILSQARPGWSIKDVLNRRKVLLVPLSAGELGEDASALFGALLFSRIWQASQGRSALAPSSRTPAMIYLDEFQTMLRLPTKLGDVLARSRKLGLGLTLAHQHLGQLTPEIRSDLANARSRIIFQLGVDDSRQLVKQLPQMTPEDLQNLPRYELVAHLASGGSISSPATGRSRPLADSKGYAQKLIQASRNRYGRPVEEVEAEQFGEHQPSSGAIDLFDIPVGARPIDDRGEEDV